MHLVKFWEWWVGDSDEFTIETRGLHAVIGVSIVLLHHYPDQLVIGLKWW